MSRRIYTKLAITNIKNNRKTYIPYILASSLSVMMYFIMDGLTQNESLGEGKFALVLGCATVVVMVFSVIFLFYTNSFLIKRRKKEIGVYNILGMGKRHIAKMLISETLAIGGISIGAGMAAGALFSKLMWLFLIRLLNYEVNIEFMLSKGTVFKTLLVFGCIFAMTLTYNLMQVKLSNPAELLRGASQGEREPKTKLLFTLAGFLLVGYGYYIAVTTESPLAAIEKFFLTVILVILGTYALFMTGSIAFLKLLRKKKSYYYKSRHFIAVSGMIYRMKQNAAGLASICVLSTIVLVLLSTSICMYMGAEDMLYERYPRDIEVKIYVTDEEKEEKLSEIISSATEKYGVKIDDARGAHYGAGTALREENAFTLKESGQYESEDICEFYMLSLEEYNKMEGKKIELEEDEVLFFSTKESMYGWKTLTIDGKKYRVREELADLWVEEKNEDRIVEGFFLVFDQMESVEEWLQDIYGESDRNKDWLDSMRSVKYQVEFDLAGNKEDCLAASREILSGIDQGIELASYESRENARQGWYGLYGGLLFVGIFLGLMFLVATVLIIYYKQISEGHDDRERYQIMQKVGMDQREVKRSIRSQVLMVFFLPLMIAVLHVSVAFKVVKKLLAALYLMNGALFLACTAATIAVFAVFYVIVYGITAREYYKIVR